MSVPPSWLTAGRAFYRKAFEHRTRPRLDASIDDWMHLSPEEHDFVKCHLLYLNLLAAGDQVALLEEIRDQLMDNQRLHEELMEGLASREDEDFVDEDGAGEDDGFFGEEELENSFSEADTFELEEDEEQPLMAPAEAPVVIDVPSETTEVRAEEG